MWSCQNSRTQCRLISNRPEEVSEKKATPYRVIVRLHNTEQTRGCLRRRQKGRGGHLPTEQLPSPSAEGGGGGEAPLRPGRVTLFSRDSAVAVLPRTSGPDVCRRAA